MFFIPDEVNPVSSVRQILDASAKVYVNVTTNFRWVLSLDDPIFNEHPHRITAIKAWGVDLN
jgi:hypothetical protein